MTYSRPTRPYPAPTSPFLMHQRWQYLLFAHWPISPSLLRPLIPSSLTLDTFKDAAYIAIVPFTMSNIRLRRCPSIPGTSAFHELNVRTYVTHHNKPGVWFFSLDAHHRLAVAVARRWFHLNYKFARISLQHQDQSIHYTSTRPDQSAQFIAQYQPTSDPTPSSPNSFEHFLTERYCLYTTNKQNQLFRGEIDHDPWPLQSASAQIHSNTMLQPLHLTLPDTQPLLHYSQSIDVRIWPLQRVE